MNVFSGFLAMLLLLLILGFIGGKEALDIWLAISAGLIASWAFWARWGLNQ